VTAFPGAGAIPSVREKFAERRKSEVVCEDEASDCVLAAFDDDMTVTNDEQASNGGDETTLSKKWFLVSRSANVPFT